MGHMGKGKSSWKAEYPAVKNVKKFLILVLKSWYLKKYLSVIVPILYIIYSILIYSLIKYILHIYAIILSKASKEKIVAKISFPVSLLL